METITVSGYSWWASYLINGDASGLEPDDLAQCQAWLAFQGLAAADCFDCTEDAEFTTPDGPFELLGDCVDYMFSKK